MPTRSVVRAKMPLNAAHIAAPRSAVISTAMPAYRFGRVIRLRRSDVDDFIERSRIPPGTLEHLHPELSRDRDADAGDEDER